MPKSRCRNGLVLGVVVAGVVLVAAGVLVRVVLVKRVPFGALVWPVSVPGPPGGGRVSIEGACPVGVGAFISQWRV